MYENFGQKTRKNYSGHKLDLWAFEAANFNFLQREESFNSAGSRTLDCWFNKKSNAVLLSYNNSAPPFDAQLFFWSEGPFFPTGQLELQAECG